MMSDPIEDAMRSSLAHLASDRDLRPEHKSSAEPDSSDSTFADDFITSMYSRLAKLRVDRIFGKDVYYSKPKVVPEKSREEKQRSLFDLVQKCLPWFDRSWDTSPLVIQGLLTPLKDFQAAGERRMQELEEAFQGALLADDMGLGKTLQILSLILAQKQSGATKGPTLVVVEKGLLDNWKEQYEKHVDPRYMNFAIHYKDADQYSTSHYDLSGPLDFDVVLTTYETVRKEYEELLHYQSNVSQSQWREYADGTPMDLDAPEVEPEPCPTILIYGMAWKRVVLDEGHRMRGSNTKLAQAIKSPELGDGKRIFVSGTPYFNYYRDIGAVFGLLRIKPLDDLEIFKGIFCEKKGTLDLRVSGLRLDTLVIVFSSITIRRMQKDHVKLPGFHETTVGVNLDKTKAIDYQSKNPCFNLRTEWETQDMVRSEFDHTAERCEALSHLDYLHARMSTAHWAVHRAYKKKTAPITVEADEEQDEAGEEVAVLQSWYTEMTQTDTWASSKMVCVVQIIKAFLEDDPTSKIVVFDPWIASLRILGIGLSHNGIEHVEYHGQVAMKKRNAALRDFKITDPKSPKVILATSKSLGTGHDLTVANVVILLTPDYTPNVETRCWKRAYRIGQTRPVTVVHVKAHNSIDLRTIERFQRHKDEQCSDLFSGSLNLPLQVWRSASYAQFEHDLGRYLVLY